MSDEEEKRRFSPKDDEVSGEKLGSPKYHEDSEEKLSLAVVRMVEREVCERDPAEICQRSKKEKVKKKKKKERISVERCLTRRSEDARKSVSVSSPLGPSRGADRSCHGGMDST